MDISSTQELLNILSHINIAINNKTQTKCNYKEK